MPIDVTHLQTLLASEWKLRHIFRYHIQLKFTVLLLYIEVTRQMVIYYHKTMCLYTKRLISAYLLTICQLRLASYNTCTHTSAKLHHVLHKP